VEPMPPAHSLVRRAVPWGPRQSVQHSTRPIPTQSYRR
jgi:hypothetical protein